MIELDVFVSKSVSSPAEFSEPSTSNSISGTTLEQVRPFPKAEYRTSKRCGRKPGRWKILTDTPEKKEIEEKHTDRMNKRKRKPVRKSMFGIEATSSEELSDNVDSSDSTDDASSTAAYGSDIIEKGNFCLTRLQDKILNVFTLQK